LVLVSLGRPASAGISGDLEASRTPRPPRLDGRVDDPVWVMAPVYRDFVALYPEEGVVPSEPTELRVLYDDENLYVGFVCHDSRPDAIVRALGDRDAPPISDTVEVAIDFAHDRRTAQLFGVNAGGVQYDRLLFADNREAPEWDGVWDAKVAARPDGWSAELVIPFRLFRGSSALARVRGFFARRHLARNHEDVASTLIPRKSNEYVSLFGSLSGVQDLPSRHDLELLPYVASRAVWRPQSSDPALLGPRLVDPSTDVGLDLRAGLARGLQLNATINPDFGQVEADQIILNLTNQEAAFPEKRPFFFQGTDVFQPLAIESSFGENQLVFYSRRIGLGTPILGAAKVVGEAGPHVQIGMLDALVMGARATTLDESDPDRRVRLHATRPFHVGPNDEALATDAATENFLAGTLVYRLGQASAVGARVASAVPLEGTCTAAQLAANPDRPPIACLVTGSNVAALDWTLHSPEAEWLLDGQAELSQVVGGPESRVMPDGVLIRRGQLGFGGYLQAGKLGGEPFRFEVDAGHVSPSLELNGAGFLPTQNQDDLLASFHYTRPNGFAGLHGFDSSLGGHARWTADGRGIDRGRNVNLVVNAVLPGFHTVGIDTGYEFSHFDVREITGRGIPFERTAVFYVSGSGETDPSRAASIGLSFAHDFVGASAVTPAGGGFTAGVNAKVRPQSRFESKLSLTINRTPQGPRWDVAQSAGNRLAFGDLHTGYLSAIFRQQVVLMPRLVVQAYGQLFTDQGRYVSSFAAMPIDDRPLRLRDLAPDGTALDGFAHVDLRANVVVRWEYRPGSTVFLVYDHASESVLASGTPTPTSFLPGGLTRGRVVDTALVKWSYFWHL
jgi:hypothetical protein